MNDIAAHGVAREKTPTQLAQLKLPLIVLARSRRSKQDPRIEIIDTWFHQKQSCCVDFMSQPHEASTRVAARFNRRHINKRLRRLKTYAAPSLCRGEVYLAYGVGAVQLPALKLHL